MGDTPDPSTTPPERRSCLGRIGSILTGILAIIVAAIILILIKVFFFVFLHWLSDTVF